MDLHSAADSSNDDDLADIIPANPKQFTFTHFSVEHAAQISSANNTLTPKGHPEILDHISHHAKPSIVDGLLNEIYDRYGHPSSPGYYRNTDSVDSDNYTDGSTISEQISKKSVLRDTPSLSRSYLAAKGLTDLREIVADMQRRVTQMSTKLVKQLRRRDRNRASFLKNCDVLTAILQAVSQKRSIDTRMKFSLDPPVSKKGYRQWHDALRAMARLPNGLPYQWRKTIWLRLAERHIQNLHIDWEQTVRFAFNDKSNPDDDKLGIQIVKDLHRTGCSGFCSQNDEHNRVVLKRVLLAYARWNKLVGYCQGFNVLAALILDVVDGCEEDALKVMIYLVDCILPQNYFSNNLRALSVDMAVFRELLHLKLPDLGYHLDGLQQKGNVSSGISSGYEPPLTNVFTMQWFLTLFATCLPKLTVLRIWDSVLLEGSEVLIRVALAIWASIGEKIALVQSADEFYSVMGCLMQRMLEEDLVANEDLLHTVYNMAGFPFPTLSDLREKYTYNITPFSPMSQTVSSPPTKDRRYKDSEDDMIVSCFTGMLLTPAIQGGPSASGRKSTDQSGSNEFQESKVADLNQASPGAYASQPVQMSEPHLERMSTDINALQRQYSRMQKKQLQLHVLKCGQNSQSAQSCRVEHPSPLETNLVINHLFVSRAGHTEQLKMKQYQLPVISSSAHVVNHLKLKPPTTNGKRKAARRPSANGTMPHHRALSATYSQLRPNIKPNLGINDRPVVYRKSNLDSALRMSNITTSIQTRSS